MSIGPMWRYPPPLFPEEESGVHCSPKWNWYSLGPKYVNMTSEARRRMATLVRRMRTKGNELPSAMRMGRITQANKAADRIVLRISLDSLIVIKEKQGLGGGEGG